MGSVHADKFMRLSGATFSKLVLSAVLHGFSGGISSMKFNIFPKLTHATARCPHPHGTRARAYCITMSDREVLPLVYMLSAHLCMLLLLKYSFPFPSDRQTNLMNTRLREYAGTANSTKCKYLRECRANSPRVPEPEQSNMLPGGGGGCKCRKKCIHYIT